MSLIPGDPVAQSLVQQNMLQREFQDGLLPSFLYRAEVAASEEWTGQAGDTKTFTGTGFMDIDTTPKDPRVDPTPKEYPFEQWSATLNDWKDTADVQMTQSYNSIQSLYLEKAKKLGINAGATLNRIIRQRLFNPAQAGWTVANTAQSATTTLRVERLNGFTTARRPDLPAGSPVRYDPVSAANPLQITIQTSATTTVTRNVTGFVSDFFILGAPDEFGPGTLTLDAAVTVADRAAVIASNATWLWRAGTGYDPQFGKIDQITSANLLRFNDIQAAVANFNIENVQPHADGFFHMHISPISERQLFGDVAFQRLETSRGLNDNPYLRNVISTTMGCVFIRNNENPIPQNVANGRAASYANFYANPGTTPTDALGFELWNTGNPTTGRVVQRALLVGEGFLKEYLQKQAGYVTDAGVMGIVVDPDGQVSNNGVVIRMRGVNMYIRAAQNRTMDQVSMTWRCIGDWVGRPDGTTGGPAKTKRVASIEHATGLT